MLTAQEAEIAALILQEIRSRLGYLLAVGLDYLTLDRQSRTLSGGELARVDLTRAVGSSLVNTLYVLDEPSVGLHPRDSQRLVEILKELRSKENTVVVVEHEAEIIREADHIIDLGPRAGEQGGEVMFAGLLRASCCAREVGNSGLPHRSQVDSPAPQTTTADPQAPLDRARRAGEQSCATSTLRFHSAAWSVSPACPAPASPR